MILTWFGDIMLATKPPKVRGRHVRILLDRLHPGDIILRSYNYYLDSYFIKGEYTHSGIYIGGDTVIHAVAEGVCRIDSIDFIKDSDDFMILRPNFPCVKKEKAIQWVVKQLGKPYDFFFSKKEKSAFYCHELSYNYLQIADVLINPEEKIIYAKDLRKVCSVIYKMD